MEPLSRYEDIDSAFHHTERLKLLTFWYLSFCSSQINVNSLYTYEKKIRNCLIALDIFKSFDNSLFFCWSKRVSRTFGTPCLFLRHARHPLLSIFEIALAIAIKLTIKAVMEYLQMLKMIKRHSRGRLSINKLVFHQFCRNRQQLFWDVASWGAIISVVPWPVNCSAVLIGPVWMISRVITIRIGPIVDFLRSRYIPPVVSIFVVSR